jgi:hypothetical protein
MLTRMLRPYPRLRAGRSPAGERVCMWLGIVPQLILFLNNSLFARIYARFAPFPPQIANCPSKSIPAFPIDKTLFNAKILFIDKK